MADLLAGYLNEPILEDDIDSDDDASIDLDGDNGNAFST